MNEDWQKMVFAILLATIMVLAMTGSIYSQDKVGQINSTNIEEFAAQDGLLSQKDFLNVGEFKKCEFQVLIITDLINSSSQTGLRIELSVYTGSSFATRIAYLDLDEIEALIQSLILIENEVLPSTRENYCEVIYTSRSGFSFGCYWSNNSWKCFMKLEKYYSDSRVDFKPKKFPQLKEILLNAKLKTKK